MSFKRPALPLLITAAAIVCAAAATAAPVHAQDTAKADKEASIRRLVALMGITKLNQQIMDQMLLSLKKGNPQVPEAMWTRLRGKMNADELVDLTIPVYDRYYTQEDITGLLAFYESPLGRKVIATLPQVAQETMAIGEAWGQRKAQEAIRELEQQQQTQQRRKPAAKAPARRKSRR